MVLWSREFMHSVCVQHGRISITCSQAHRTHACAVRLTLKMHHSLYALACIPDNRDDIALQFGGPLAPLLNAWHKCTQLLQPAGSMVVYAVDCMPLIIEGDQGIPCAAIQADL